MKLEKKRVSAMKTVIARMKNDVYENQEDLMKAVLQVLCASNSSAKRQFQYNWNHFDFENDTTILNIMGLKRTDYGSILDK